MDSVKSNGYTAVLLNEAGLNRPAFFIVNKKTISKVLEHEDN